MPQSWAISSTVPCDMTFVCTSQNIRKMVSANTQSAVHMCKARGDKVFELNHNMLAVSVDVGVNCS